MRFGLDFSMPELETYSLQDLAGYARMVSLKPGLAPVSGRRHAEAFMDAVGHLEGLAGVVMDWDLAGNDRAAQRIYRLLLTSEILAGNAPVLPTEGLAQRLEVDGGLVRKIIEDYVAEGVMEIVTVDGKETLRMTLPVTSRNALEGLILGVTEFAGLTDAIQKAGA